MDVAELLYGAQGAAAGGHQQATVAVRSGGKCSSGKTLDTQQGRYDSQAAVTTNGHSAAKNSAAGKLGYTVKGGAKKTPVDVVDAAAAAVAASLSLGRNQIPARTTSEPGVAAAGHSYVPRASSFAGSAASATHLKPGRQRDATAARGTAAGCVFSRITSSGDRSGTSRSLSKVPVGFGSSRGSSAGGVGRAGHAAAASAAGGSSASATAAAAARAGLGPLVDSVAGAAAGTTVCTSGAGVAGFKGGQTTKKMSKPFQLVAACDGAGEWNGRNTFCQQHSEAGVPLCV